jgi:hypothetical protein
MGLPHAVVVASTVVIASTPGPHTAAPPSGSATRSAALPPRFAPHSGPVPPGPLLGR